MNRTFTRIVRRIPILMAMEYWHNLQLVRQCSNKVVVRTNVTSRLTLLSAPVSTDDVDDPAIPIEPDNASFRTRHAMTRPIPTQSTRRAARFVIALATALLPMAPAAWAQVPGPNVNMVSGTTLPDGDPYLQRQNEPSAAVS